MPIQAGLITEDDLQTALVEQSVPANVGVVLVRLNLAANTSQRRWPSSWGSVRQPGRTRARSDLSRAVPKEVALKRICIATTLEKNLLTVAMSDRCSSASSRTSVDRLSHQAGGRDAQRHHRRHSDLLSRQALMRTTPESRAELAVTTPAGRTRVGAEVPTGERRWPAGWRRKSSSRWPG
jgi:hypothetical protein